LLLLDADDLATNRLDGLNIDSERFVGDVEVDGDVHEDEDDELSWLDDCDEDDDLLLLVVLFVVVVVVVGAAAAAK